MEQLSLGQLIAKLDAIVARSSREEGENEPRVYFDFGDLYPTEFTSWRGDYSHLALCFAGTSYKDPGAKTVSDFLKMCKDTVGKTCEGYKGGNYVMSEKTLVWIANWGHSSHTALFDVLDADYMIYLVTGLEDY